MSLCLSQMKDRWFSYSCCVSILSFPPPSWSDVCCQTICGATNYRHYDRVGKVTHGVQIIMFWLQHNCSGVIPQHLKHVEKIEICITTSWIGKHSGDAVIWINGSDDCFGHQTNNAGIAQIQRFVKNRHCRKLQADWAHSRNVAGLLSFQATALKTTFLTTFLASYQVIILIFKFMNSSLNLQI